MVTLNEVVLQRLLAWGASLPDFDLTHARDGLFVAQGWTAAGATVSTDDLFLLALPITFTVWIDDRSDRHLRDAESPVDWRTILGAAASGSLAQIPDAAEVGALQSVSKLLRERSTEPTDHELWLSSCVRMLEAMQFEERCARRKQQLTYAERIETGAFSTGIEMILMAAYLVLGAGRARRANDDFLVDAERAFFIYQRLLNDLHSAQKERIEVETGPSANAVLLMESVMPVHLARRWVHQQCEAYRALMNEKLAQRDTSDACVKLLRCMCDQVESWYENNPERYET